MLNFPGSASAFDALRSPIVAPTLPIEKDLDKTIVMEPPKHPATKDRIQQAPTNPPNLIVPKQDSSRSLRRSDIIPQIPGPAPGTEQGPDEAPEAEQTPSPAPKGVPTPKQQVPRSEVPPDEDERPVPLPDVLPDAGGTKNAAATQADRAGQSTGPMPTWRLPNWKLPNLLEPLDPPPTLPGRQTPGQAETQTTPWLYFSDTAPGIQSNSDLDGAEKSTQQPFSRPPNQDFSPRSSPTDQDLSPSFNPAIKDLPIRPSAFNRELLPPSKLDELLSGARSAMVSGVDASTEVLADALQSGANIVKRGKAAAARFGDVVLPAVNAGLDRAEPYWSRAEPYIRSFAQQAASLAWEATRLAASLLNQLLQLLLDIPALQRASQRLQTFLSPVLSVASGIIQFVMGTGPVKLLQALAAFVAVFAGLPLLNRLFRGYNGDVSALTALSDVYNTAGCLLVDIRSAEEKSRQGSHNLPEKLGSRWLEVEFDSTINKKTRAQLRNPEQLSAQITALEISDHKAVSKKDKLMLVDVTDSARARAVARSLKALGFSKVYVVSGGFMGKKGWKQSKLPSKDWMNTRKQVLKLLLGMEPIPGNGLNPPRPSELPWRGSLDVLDGQAGRSDGPLY